MNWKISESNEKSFYCKYWCPNDTLTLICYLFIYSSYIVYYITRVKYSTSYCYDENIKRQGKSFLKTQQSNGIVLEPLILRKRDFEQIIGLQRVYLDRLLSLMGYNLSTKNKTYANNRTSIIYLVNLGILKRISLRQRVSNQCKLTCLFLIVFTLGRPLLHNPKTFQDGLCRVEKEKRIKSTL